MGRKRNDNNNLPPEDLSLWALVTHDVTPMERGLQETAGPEKPLPPAPPRKKKADRAVPVPASTTAPSTPPQLDGATMRKLRRGQIPIEGRIDLHGMTQDKAKAALFSFVRGAASRGARCVLVITGKGKGLGEERGILRRRLPDWLAEPSLSALVLRHQEAARKDGGAGAYYLYLKRAKV